MKVRAADPADLRKVIAWLPAERTAWVMWAGPGIDPESTPAELWSAIGASATNAFVLECEQAGPVAFGQVAATRAGHARVARLVVRPDHRNQGVGRRAVEELLAIARQRQGARTVDLEVYPSNLDAVRLYRRLGFREAESSHPALVRMERSLGEG